MRVLVCLYTCEEHRQYLQALHRSPLMGWMRRQDGYRIIEVQARQGGATHQWLENQLILPCAEGYGNLSEKTHAMIQACLELEFDFLLKLDATLSAYHSRRHSKSAAMMTLLTPDSVLRALLQPSFFSVAYNGLLQQAATREGVENWARLKQVPCSYLHVFENGENTPPYYLGKFYALRRDLCAYVAEHGRAMALDHVSHLGGSEDIMIGRLHAQWQALGAAPSGSVAAPRLG